MKHDKIKLKTKLQNFYPCHSAFVWEDNPMHQVHRRWGFSLTTHGYLMEDKLEQYFFKTMLSDLFGFGLVVHSLLT